MLYRVVVDFKAKIDKASKPEATPMASAILNPNAKCLNDQSFEQRNNFQSMMRSLAWLQYDLHSNGITSASKNGIHASCLRPLCAGLSLKRSVAIMRTKIGGKASYAAI